jgi:hypothetical protein
VGLFPNALGYKHSTPSGYWWDNQPASKFAQNQAKHCAMSADVLCFANNQQLTKNHAIMQSCNHAII